MTTLPQSLERSTSHTRKRDAATALLGDLVRQPKKFCPAAAYPEVVQTQTSQSPPLQPNHCGLVLLPDELLVELLSLLDLKSLGRVAITCKRLSALSRDSVLWRYQYAAVDGDSLIPPSLGRRYNWRRLVRATIAYRKANYDNCRRALSTDEMRRRLKLSPEYYIARSFPSPLSLEQIEFFERRNSACLPEGYRYLLQKLGNGGPCAFSYITNKSMELHALDPHAIYPRLCEPFPADTPANLLVFLAFLHGAWRTNHRTLETICDQFLPEPSVAASLEGCASALRRDILCELFSPPQKPNNNDVLDEAGVVSPTTAAVDSLTARQIMDRVRQVLFPLKGIPPQSGTEYPGMLEIGCSKDRAVRLLLIVTGPQRGSVWSEIGGRYLVPEHSCIETMLVAWQRRLDMKHEAFFRPEQLFSSGMAFWRDIDENGHAVVGLDESHSLKLFELAAERGHLTAMVCLGHSFYYGIGTGIDVDVAEEWYKKAAEHGCESAANALAELYRRKADYWRERAVKMG